MHVSYIPLGIPFLQTLAKYILEKYTALELAQCTIYLPTRRACYALKKIIGNLSPSNHIILPSIIPLGDLDETQLYFKTAAGAKFVSQIPNVISSEEKTLILSTLITKFPLSSDRQLSLKDAVFIAEYLAKLLNDFEEEDIPLENLKNISPPAKAAEHWEILLKFLNILSVHWSEILLENNLITPKQKRNMLMMFQAKEWEKNPACHPVIIAGSMGTIPATVHMMRAVARLPEGIVILPGLVAGLDAETLEESHPQFSLYKLLKNLNIPSDKVSPLSMPGTSNRSLLFSTCFDSSDRQSSQIISARDLKNIFYAKCSHMQNEVDLICLYIMEGLQQHKRIVCITDSKALASRIQLKLNAKSIPVKNGLKKAFGETREGSFLRLTSRCFSKDFSLADCMGMLKHSLSNRFKQDILKFEKEILRDSKRQKNIEMHCFDSAFQNLIKNLLHTINNPNVEIRPLSHWIELHENIMRVLSGVEDLETLLYDEEQSFSMEGFWDSFKQAANNQNMYVEDYAAFFKAFTDPISVPDAAITQPFVEIVTPLDARLLEADRIILADMNEGVWPTLSYPDPFFSIAMRQSMGLPSIQRRQGQAAHDFLQLLNTPEVLLTSSAVTQDSPSVSCAFLSLIISFLKERNLSLQAPLQLQKWNEQLETVLPSTVSIHRPNPSPPVDVRPKKLFVTDVEKLIKNPYEIYAKHILRLTPLQPLNAHTEPKDFGILIHELLEEWTLGKLGNFEEAFVKGNILLQQYMGNAPYKNIWKNKLKKILEWVYVQPIIDKTLFAEVTGQLVISLEKENFTLCAKADRIEVQDVNAQIIDYKTGVVPSDKDMETKASVQMPLQSLILQYGSFAGITAKPTGLAFWDLGSDPCSVHPYQGDIQELIRTTLAGIKKLLHDYTQEETAYIPLVSSYPYPGSYDHLSRVQEWSRAR